LSGTNIFLTVVYIIYVAAPLVRDELWLRIVLTVASVCFVIWGVLTGEEIVIIANGLFALLSLRQVYRLMKERRPIGLTDEQSIAHQALFPTMTARQFVLFWHLGEGFSNDDGVLIRKGAQVEHVSAIVTGEVAVKLESGDRLIDAPTLLGEMSFVRGHDAPASADVRAIGLVTGRRWKKSTLYSLKDSHPNLTEPFLRSLGADLAAKIAG